MKCPHCKLDVDEWEVDDIVMCLDVSEKEARKIIIEEHVEEECQAAHCGFCGVRVLDIKDHDFRLCRKPQVKQETLFK